MNMVPVASSNIAAVGWEGNILAVEFTSGQTYRYTGVSRALFDRMMSAPSKGAFFQQFIRGKYSDDGGA
ncbi:MAG: KTSC domain-containing protein [Pseudomonadota bacterium]